MSILISRYASNTEGRDFALGDLHGETELLWRKLNLVGFDPLCDRVFSVGDLIDRGRDSAGALGLLEQPWFYPVQGNHENMLIDATLYELEIEQWHAIGGDWSRWVPQHWLKRQARLLEKLPHIIVVGEGRSRFNIVHAGMLDNEGKLLTDFDIDNTLAQQVIDPDPLIWSRALAREYWKVLQGKAQADSWHPGLSLTFCGHTPVTVPGLFKSHYFLDGGSGYARVANIRQGEPFLVDVSQLMQELSARGTEI